MINFSSFFWSSQVFLYFDFSQRWKIQLTVLTLWSLLWPILREMNIGFVKAFFKQEKLIVFVWVNFIIEIYIKAVGKLFFIHELLLKIFEVSAVSTPPIDLSVDWPNVFLCRPIVRQLLKCLRYQRLRR